MFVVASSFCVAPTFAQDAGGEDPSLEDNDEVVIEDEPIIDGEVIDEIVIDEVVVEEVVIEEVDDVVIPDEGDVEIVIEVPELTPNEIAAIERAEQEAWQHELGQRLLTTGNAAAAAGRWREAC